MNQIKHVAIIMDGNGRWGIKQGKTRNFGHEKGICLQGIPAPNFPPGLARPDESSKSVS